MAVYKMTEWQSAGSGSWQCNDVSQLGAGKGAWYYAAAAINLTPFEYVKLLVEKFRPDELHWNPERNTLIFSWKSQADMRKFKNYVNKEARKYNFPY